MKAELLEQKAQLVAYCVSKMKAGDWHAVQDAASDIREIDAKLSVLAEMKVPEPILHVHQFVYNAQHDRDECRCGAVEATQSAELRRIG